MSLIGTIIEFTYIGGTLIDRETYTNKGTIFDNYNENQYLVAKEMLYGPIMYLIFVVSPGSIICTLGTEDVTLICQLYKDKYEPIDTPFTDENSYLSGCIKR